MNKHIKRRNFIKTIAATPLLLPSRLAAKRQRPTAPQTAGPFYPEFPTEQPQEKYDANLLTTNTGSPTAKGETLALSGEVTTIDGAAIANATVEIWQCDATGHYHHPADRPSEARDDNFQGYGQTQTSENGRYEFLTIVPVGYPGRTPHIHVAITVRGYRPLTTQMYIADAANNANDVLYQRLSTAEQRSLTVPIVSSRTPGTPKRAYFLITMA